MYEPFFGFNEKPFSLRPDPAYLYLGEEHSMALAVLKCGLLNEASFTVVTGEIGAGKTTLIRHLLRQVKTNITIGVISNTHRSFGELLQWILAAFNLEYRNKEKVDLYQAFTTFLDREYARNRRTVLIIDEAQNLDAEILEELRVLSNVNADKDQVLQVVLVGQPELRDVLRRPDMLQFAQRITVAYHLKALNLQEADSYIRHRLRVAGGDPFLFDAMACKLIFEHSDGIPRLINVLCDTALVYAFAEQKKLIDAVLVSKVIRDREQDVRSSESRSRPSQKYIEPRETQSPVMSERPRSRTDNAADNIANPETPSEALQPPTLEDLRMLFGNRVHNK